MRLSMAWAGPSRRARRSLRRATRRGLPVSLKRAIMVGCNSAGVNVDDLEVATVPVTRHQVRSASSIGGVTVRLAEHDPQSVVIRFFDQAGSTSTRERSEGSSASTTVRSFRRASAPDIGDIGFPGRALEHYTSLWWTRWARAPAGVDVIAAAEFKLVLDYSFGTTSFVMPNVLAKLGAEVLVVNPYASTAAVMASDRARRPSMWPAS